MTLLAAALVAIALVAYRRGREGGLLLLAAAFALFLGKGLLLTAHVFTGAPDLGTYAALGGLLDVLILGLLYGTTLRR